MIIFIDFYRIFDPFFDFFNIEILKILMLRELFIVFDQKSSSFYINFIKVANFLSVFYHFLTISLRSSYSFYRFLSLFDHFSSQFIDNLGQFHWFLIDFWPIFGIFLGKSSEEIIFTCFLWKNGTFSAFLGFFPIHFASLYESISPPGGKARLKKRAVATYFSYFLAFLLIFYRNNGRFT